MLAGNNTTEANAVAASRSAGINNMLQLGGMLIGGATPGRSGSSPFGSMATGAKNMLMMGG